MQNITEENSSYKIQFIDRNKIQFFASSYQYSQHSDSDSLGNSLICSCNSKNMRRHAVKGLDFRIGSSQIVSSVDIQSSFLLYEATNLPNSSLKTVTYLSDKKMIQKKKSKKSKKSKKVNQILSEKKHSQKQNKQNSFCSQQRTSNTDSNQLSFINQSRNYFQRPKNISFDQKSSRLIMESFDGKQHRVKRTFLNIETSNIKLRNQVIERIQLQQPQKFQFLLKVYTAQSLIKLQILKRNFISSKSVILNEFKINQLENHQQKYYYSLDMSHKPVKIIDITRFRWKGLIKLKLKSSFLCDKDWMVIVENACNFPHLEQLNLGNFLQYLESNYIQNVSYQHLSKLQKGMQQLKQLCLVQNQIQQEHIEQIRKFSRDSGITILINETFLANLQNSAINHGQRNNHIKSNLNKFTDLNLDSDHSFHRQFKLKYYWTQIPQYNNFALTQSKSANGYIKELNDSAIICENQDCPKQQIGNFYVPRYNQLSEEDIIISSSSKEACSYSSFLHSISSSNSSSFFNDYSLNKIESIQTANFFPLDIPKIDNYDIQNVSILSCNQDILDLLGQQEMQTISLRIPQYKILLINLAQIGSDKNQHKKNYIETLEKVLQIEKKIFGTQSYTVVIRMNNIGCFYWSYGNLQNAMHFYFKCLQILISDVDKKYIDFQTILNITPQVSTVKSNLKKTVQQFCNSMSVITTILGPQLITIATIFNNIGSVYMKQGYYQKAIQIFSRSFFIETRAFRTLFTDSAIITLKNLQNALLKKGIQPEEIDIFTISLQNQARRSSKKIISTQIQFKSARKQF